MTTPKRPIPAEHEEVDRSMRARQLASSVRQGRKVMFTILDEDPLDGYLCGWDADTYFLIYPGKDEVYKELIPKQNILKIMLFDKRTFREEPLYEEMDKVVKPFRTLINEQYFESR